MNEPDIVHRHPYKGLEGIEIYGLGYNGNLAMNSGVKDQWATAFQMHALEVRANL